MSIACVRELTSAWRQATLTVVSAAVLFLPALDTHARSAQLGLNTYDLANQYQGRASGGTGSTAFVRVTRSMGKKSIADAYDAGATFLRVSATGYGPAVWNKPGDLDLWRSNPDRYWSNMDEMMTDLEANGLKAVFTFNWNITQFPSMTGERVGDLLTNEQSASSRLAVKYMTEFVTRYRERNVVLFYELTNELNLQADIDWVGRCQREKLPPTLCNVRSNFTTQEMISFIKRFADQVKALDPRRSVSSGFSAPRPSAAQLRARPEWLAPRDKVDRWDTEAEFQRYLQDVHAPVDIISVHLYPEHKMRGDGGVIFSGARLLERVKKASDRIGKPLFLGEFGDPSDLSGNPNSFTSQMLAKILELQVPYSAIWSWQHFPHALVPEIDDRQAAYSIEPGRHDALIARFRDTSARMGQVVRSPAKDREPPRVILIWPLECQTLMPEQVLYAVASDSGTGVASVDFRFGSKLLAKMFQPPYKFTWLTSGTDMAGPDFQLTVRATDHAGNAQEYRTPVQVGNGSNCGDSERERPTLSERGR